MYIFPMFVSLVHVGMFNSFKNGLNCDNSSV